MRNFKAIAQQCVRSLFARSITMTRSTQRQGQARFRAAALEIFDEQCPITQVTDATFLQAAHLVPWSLVRTCDDVENSILLYQPVHTAMDRGYISFDEEGKLWQRSEVDISHLHIRRAEIPEKYLTAERQRWLMRSHSHWLETHVIRTCENNFTPRIHRGVVKTVMCVSEKKIGFEKS